MRAKEFIPTEKPRNFVAKNAKMGGAGQHKDKKKAEKQGDFKHKNKQYAEDVAEGLLDRFINTNNTKDKKISIGDYTLEIQTKNDKLFVYVTTAGEDAFDVAEAEFNIKLNNHGKKYLESEFTKVYPKYQRKGIATMIYRYVKSLGYDVQPSSTQTDSGKSMWKGFRDKGVAEGKSGAKYKIKSIGSEGGKDYYISPNTGKKVYKKAKVGDHETPSGEHKPEIRMPYKENVADEGVLSFLKTEPEKKKWDPAKDSRVISNKKDNDDAWIKLLVDKRRRGIELTDREWNSIEQWKLKRAMGAESAQVQELSTDLLGRYKKAAGDQATAADKAGDYDKGHKRFKGIVKATNKQFDNDAKERK